VKFDTAPAPHLRPGNHVARVMQRVLLALVPAGIVHVAMFGPGLVIQVLIAASSALACEYAVLRLRGRPARAALGDYSALVMAVLLAFALPPLTPWWITVTASSFAIIVAKQLYGGLGYNLFNPAMAGYLAVLISFPEAMTRWPPVGLVEGASGPGAWQTLQIIATGHSIGGDWDALTMATPLDQVRTQLGQMRMLSEVLGSGALHGRGAWLVFQAAVLAGGAALLALRIIRWHIPIATLAGVTLCAALLQILDADLYPSAWFHLTAGSAMLCAFFIATDPVSAATSRRGRLIYGFGIGVLIVLIRSFGIYPDGVAFAVVLMNAAVPLIDYYTIPRAHGQRKTREDLL
jgi:electron transport complex protein RnfD